jgi:hypothetical protein
MVITEMKAVDSKLPGPRGPFPQSGQKFSNDPKGQEKQTPLPSQNWPLRSQARDFEKQRLSPSSTRALTCPWGHGKQLNCLHSELRHSPPGALINLLLFWQGCPPFLAWEVCVCSDKGFCAFCGSSL